MNFFLIAVLLCCSKTSALPAPQVGTTSNATNHDESNLSCTPTSWTDVASFFIGNYVAHAATVRSYPGEGNSSMVIAMLAALLLPTSGLVRGLNGIFRNAKFHGTGKKFWRSALATPDYQTAAAAGALCMLVRTPKWRPRAGDQLMDVIARNRCEIDASHAAMLAPVVFQIRRGIYTLKFSSGVEIRPDPEPQAPREMRIYRPPWVQERSRYWTFSDTSNVFVESSRTVQGSYDLKDLGDEYAFAHVPRAALILPPSTGSTATPVVIGASYSLPTALIAIVQLIYAIVTLYETTRGAQITSYGYAAFGLTVVPYAMMSLVNLISALTTPAYSTMLMVGSDIMDEAVRRGAVFDGFVGRLAPDEETEMIAATVSAAENSSPHQVNDLNVEKTISMNFSCHKSSEDVAQDVTYSVNIPDPDQDGTINLEQTYLTDTRPTLFIPSCSKFKRSCPDMITINTNSLTPGPGGLSFQEEELSFQMPYAYDKMIASVINGCIIIAIIGGISHFRKGESTISQRVWLMLWYVIGFYIGGTISDTLDQTRRANDLSRRVLPGRRENNNKKGTLMLIVTTFSFGVPSVGGFVVVAQMLYHYGTCTVK